MNKYTDDKKKRLNREAKEMIQVTQAALVKLKGLLADQQRSQAIPFIRLNIGIV